MTWCIEYHPSGDDGSYATCLTCDDKARLETYFARWLKHCRITDGSYSIYKIEGGGEIDEHGNPVPVPDDEARPNVIVGSGYGCDIQLPD